MITNFTAGRKYRYNGPRLSEWKLRGKSGFVVEATVLVCTKALAGGYALFSGQTPTSQAGRNGCWDYSKLLRHFEEVSDTGAKVVETSGVTDLNAIKAQVQAKYFSDF